MRVKKDLAIQLMEKQSATEIEELIDFYHREIFVKKDARCYKFDYQELSESKRIVLKSNNDTASSTFLKAIQR